MRRLALLAALLTASCSSLTAHQARTSLLGMNAVDLQGCMGVPNSTTRLDSGELLLQYNFDSDKPGLTLGALGFSVGLGPTGSCHALIRVLRSGVVSGVNYAGTTLGWQGQLAACAPLIGECIRNPDSTTLPQGYDAFSELLPTKSVGTLK